MYRHGSRSSAYLVLETLFSALGPTLTIGLIVLFVVAVIVFFIRLNRGSVEQYLRERGCEIVEIHWTPFGPGWFGDKNSSIFSVIYRDSEGNTHDAYFKSGLFAGVYLTEDRVISKASSRKLPEQSPGVPSDIHTQANTPIPDVQEALFECRRLKEENRLLREELERLRS